MSVKTLLHSALLFCVLSPVSAEAQTPTPGTDPAPPSQPVRSERIAPAGAAPTLPWAVTLGVQQSYESGEDFTGSAGSGIWGSRVTGGLGRTFTLKRGAVDVHGEATQLFSQSQSNQLMYGLALSAGYALNRRLTWHASQGISSSLAQDSPVLIDAGRVFDEATTAMTMMTSGDLVYQMSEKSTMRLDVGQSIVSFQESTLTSGNSTVVRFNLSRQVNRTHTIGLSVGHTFTSGSTGDIQGVLGTWQATLGRHFSLDASGGIRPYTLAGVPGYQFAPGGRFSLAGTFDKQTVSVTYERAIEQAYGINEALGGGLTHSANRVNADYGVAVGQRLALNVNASYGMNTYPQIPGYHIGGRTLMATSRYLLARQLSLSASYGLWWRIESGIPSTSTSRAMLSLGYAFGWR